eukprot:gene23071-biopygen5798
MSWELVRFPEKVSNCTAKSCSKIRRATNKLASVTWKLLRFRRNRKQTVRSCTLGTLWCDGVCWRRRRGSPHPHLPRQASPSKPGFFGLHGGSLQYPCRLVCVYAFPRAGGCEGKPDKQAVSAAGAHAHCSTVKPAAARTTPKVPPCGH